MKRSSRTPNWRVWLRSWDAQQQSYMPNRERRFAAMLDVVGAAVPKHFTALDLGCGPGSLSVRLLRRFPSARVIAVDYDPVTLRIGRGALGSFGGRLTWVDAKLGTSHWTDHLPRRRIDAAVSTTALHWLSEASLRSLYRDLGRLLPRGGIFLDGDHIPWGPRSRGLNRLAQTVRRQRSRGAPRNQECSAWLEWWQRAEKLPALRPYFDERKRRSAEHPKHVESPPLEFHVRALRRAGFREVDVIWQSLTNRVLFARR
ncbi:MAG TPA: class I SAM-dependent methyltransferase [Thermoplasmata archaeon]|nr:class I SAM-dependent methyltransferase [Thermoplasmata archaeon]